MATFVDELSQRVLGGDGTEYRVQVWAEQRQYMWDGWLEFVAASGAPWYTTKRETTRPSWQALKSWASGLEGTYLEGAFQRATEFTPVATVLPAFG